MLKWLSFLPRINKEGSSILIKDLAEQCDIEAEVLEIVRLFIIESGGHRVISALSLNASFERDLGLGSLERVELLLRIESAFSVSLPDTALAEACTPFALVNIILNASPLNASPAKKKRVYERISIPKEGGRLIRPPKTLSEALIRHAEADPDRPHIYLTSDENQEETLTYKDLLTGAAAIAKGLSEKKIAPGETVAIMLPTGQDFFYVFLGVLLAGGIPVPVYPPFRPNQIEEYAERQTGILKNAEAVYLITFQRAEHLARLLRPRLPGLRGVLLPEVLTELAQGLPDCIVLAKETDAGLIQYTSGSTGHPKGVYLTHENLLANIRSMEKALQITPRDVGVSWLPLYHDMGLIGSWLFCLTNGIPIAIMPPFTFLSRPEKWLWALHRHSGTLSAAPNFAYEICARKIRDEAIEGLDLSSWRVALNGAEPVNPETIRRFAERFAPYGFHPEAHLPVYGMAEASVGLTFSPLARIPRIDRISRDPFQKKGEALQVGPLESNALEFVSCGFPLPLHDVRIMDEKGTPLGERVEGYIAFRGPSCTSGYYRNIEATASLFQEGWLISGDLGYKADGELFITGREKDLIIKGGRNLHPHEIEAVVGEIQGVRNGCVAVFGIADKTLGTEKLVVVFETRETGEAALSMLNTLINGKIVSAIGIPADLIVPVQSGMVLKTSSGKVARSACREAYLSGKLTRKPRRIQLQLFRLSMIWGLSWVFRGLNRVGRTLYGARFLLTLGILFIPIWLWVRIFPERQTGRILKKSAQLFLKWVGAFPSVQGLENIKKEGPVIWVANHASYLDVCFLMAVLPTGVHFVAKQELLKVPFLKTFLLKGAHITVDRKNVTKGASETEKIITLLKEGASVLIFPEGTFRAASGLRPFKLGAFKAAVETGFPVCPITLKGTRAFLRDGTFLPQRTPVTVIFGASIKPAREEWREVVRLRDLTRKEIAHYSDEVILEA